MTNKNLAKIKDKIYYVISDEDESVLIGMDLRINFNDKTISWFDTVKDRTMGFEAIIDDNPDHFVFKRSGRGEVYTFVPMTLEVYNDNVKNRILIPRDLETEEDMLKAFEETKNNAW